MKIFILIRLAIVRKYWQLHDRHTRRPAALRKAIREAWKMRRKTGKHYKVYFLEHRYQVLTRDDIQRRKHDGEFNDFVNATKMEPMAFFATITGRPSAFAAELLNAKNR